MSDRKNLSILIIEENGDRAGALRGELALMLPNAATLSCDASMVGEAPIRDANAILVDGGHSARGTAELLRLLRARGFGGPVMVLSPAPDDPVLREAMNALGVLGIDRTVADESPYELAATLTRAFSADVEVASALRQARRIFAAGQATLSLQHGINNPLAALMAEAQLLQLEELQAEHRESVDRIVELCRRVVALVRRLDVLAESERDGTH
ncbi:MAG: histidine kinase dimerization/phospho-acceptor domain-containing protein [Gemmatimonadaceae bacterium]